MKVTKLLRVARNVADLERAAEFYTGVLGFQISTPPTADAALAKLLGVERVRMMRLALGAQEIELSQCHPAGAPYPVDAPANAVYFQHIAIIATDIASAYARLQQANAPGISVQAPVQLPPASGGVIAYKFRDPDGHPLEFLQFPASERKPLFGFDHSAISVSRVEPSIAFFSQIGVMLDGRQINHGPEQDALDGLENVAVDVVTLNPPQPTPHVELLCYRAPHHEPAPYDPADICADRLVFATGNAGLTFARDPDGHVILFDNRSPG